MWHMSAINKCITTGPFFFFGVRTLCCGWTLFQSLPLCIPLHSLAHFTVPKKFWKSAIWQSTIRRLLLKIGWWLTLERLLHTYNFVYELRSNNFLCWLFRENLICSVFSWDFRHLSDICQTWNWCTSFGWHSHKALAHILSLCFTAIVTGLNISFDPRSSSPLVLPFNNLSTYSHRTNCIRTESDRKWE